MPQACPVESGTQGGDHCAMMQSSKYVLKQNQQNISALCGHPYRDSPWVYVMQPVLLTQNVGSEEIGLIRTHCTGTMFFGAATEETDACKLLNLAAERGVNCFDTAEMYPVPQSAAHQGQSEVVLGNWLQDQRRYQETTADAHSYAFDVDACRHFVLTVFWWYEQFNCHS